MGATQGRERRFLEREKYERNIVRNETEHGHYTAAEQHEMMADRYGLKADHVHWKRYRKGQCREPFAPHPDLLPTESLSDTSAGTNTQPQHLPYRVDQAVSMMEGDKHKSSFYYSGSMGMANRSHHGHSNGYNQRGGSVVQGGGYRGGYGGPNNYGNLVGAAGQPSPYLGPNNGKQLHQYW